jgi:cytochrome P450
MFADPLRHFFGFNVHRQIRKYEKLIDDEMMRILERRLADHTPGEKKDICSIAVEEMGRDGGPLTREDKVSITHQLKTFYFAGHDTTASTTSWAMWLLSQKPDVLDKVRAELKDHGLWTAALKPPTYEDLQKCIYLEAVIKETLRLYPAVTTAFRSTDDSNEAWNGYHLSGATIGLAFYAMGRHPLLWNRPEEFRPERFLDGSEEPPNSKYGISAKFTAFSKGPRDCIGKYFALIQMKLAISAFVTRYDFECVDLNERLLVLITSLPKNGAQVKFRRREACAKSAK